MSAAAQSASFVVVVAPLPEDADVLCQLVRDLDLPVRVCEGREDLEDILDQCGLDQIISVIITHEAAVAALGDLLAERLQAEPSWSSLPVTFLVDDIHAPPPAYSVLRDHLRRPSQLILPRPVAPEVLSDLIRAKADDRHRQFGTRDLLDRLREAEGHKAFLLKEVQHRIRNSMAVLQALFRLTARQHSTVSSFVESFSRRLSVLSEAHALLSEPDRRARDLGRLIREQALPYCRRDEQLILAGPDVVLAESLAFDLALVIHELATNAAKYGALTRDEGTVQVSWEHEDDGRVRLSWQEDGGPPVNKPQAVGLGGKLIGGFGGSTGATGQTTFRPGGLLWEASIPADALR